MPKPKISKSSKKARGKNKKQLSEEKIDNLEDVNDLNNSDNLNNSENMINSDNLDSEENIMNEINQQLTEAEEYVPVQRKNTDDKITDSSDIPDVFTEDSVSELSNKNSVLKDNYDNDNDNDDKDVDVDVDVDADADIDDETSKRIDEEAKKAFRENDIVDAIVRYMKTDDIISEKEQELREIIAPLKKQRTELESFLIDYLEQIDEEFIIVGKKAKLNKVETVTKLPIKPENVAEALLEGFKKHELYSEDQHDEMLKVIKDMIGMVEAKREQKIKKKITRIDVEKEEQLRIKKEEKERNKAARAAKADQPKVKVARPKAAKPKTVKATKTIKATKVAKATKTAK